MGLRWHQEPLLSQVVLPPHLAALHLLGEGKKYIFNCLMLEVRLQRAAVLRWSRRCLPGTVTRERALGTLSAPTHDLTLPAF